VHTEFHERAGIVMQGVPAFMWLDLDDVVETSLRDLDRGVVVSVPGIQYKALTTAARVIPKGVTRRLAGVIGRGRGRT
jgi:short-subunit dehydrogenase